MINPTTGNPAADAVSLAFAARFRLFTSPHIMRGVARGMRATRHSEPTVEAFIAAVIKMCEGEHAGQQVETEQVEP